MSSGVVSGSTPLLCLGCRAVSSGAALRGGTGCPHCAKSRFLRWTGSRWAFRVLDLQSR
ncbi:hypothetical protein GCM10017673_00330 [Streptosporangium violaceochromogenes]|nr:hypothetical protein GCM10017673_00330 [Streptosporangium violaceochromogenes]